MKAFLKNNWRYILLGVLILTLFSLRFYHLTILPVFVDEAIYIRWAQIMKAEETLRFLPLSDGKQPLFMWIMIPFFKFVHDPLFAGRVVSVLSGFGTLVGVTLLSYLLFKNKKVAMAAAIIYAVSPFVFFFDRMALADSMLSMFGIWTFIFAYLAITKERLDFAMLSGFALGGAWLTKSPALFFALMLPTLSIFSNWKKDFDKNVIVLLKSLALCFISIAIGFGFYNILRLGPNFHLIASRNSDYVYPLSHVLVSPLDPLKPWLLQSWQWLLFMGPFSIIVIWFYNCMVNGKKHWKELLVLLIWFLGPIFIESEYAKVLTARYILFSIPFFIVFTASSFLEQRKNWVKGLTFVLAFFIAQSLVFDYNLLVSPAKANLPRSERSGYLEEWTAGQGIKETADYLRNEQNKNPNEKIVVGTEGYFGTLPDGLQMYLYDKPEITVVGVGLDINELPQSLINSQKFRNRTYLVINSDRFKGDADKLGLKLIAGYPKAIRPDGTHQTLFLFELPKKPL